jgi:hypothetical protein
MLVKTAKVQGRRVLHFDTIDEMLAEAEKLAASNVRCLGNWSEGQILKHLAVTLESAVTGIDFSPPWIFRIIARMMKKQFLKKSMRPGFQMPEAMERSFMPPNNVSAGEGIQALRSAVSTFKSATELPPNNVFGPMTHDEAEQFHLRHAEMHLSFLIPETSA